MKLKHLYRRWSPTRKFFFWLAFIPFILMIFFFIIQFVASRNFTIDTAENFEEIKLICEAGVKDCSTELTRERVYVTDELRGSCPYTFFDIGSQDYFLSEGSLQFWIKLERLDDSFFQREDIIFGNITMGVEGKIGGAFRYQGLRDVESDRRYIVEYLDSSNNTFLQLYIMKDRIISFRIFDSRGREFVLSYDNIVPINDWAHIVVTWGDEINLFVNGVVSENKVIVSGSNFRIPLSKYYFGSSSKENDCLNGLMDEVSIWKAEIGSHQIERLYNEGEGLRYEDF